MVIISEDIRIRIVDLEVAIVLLPIGHLEAIPLGLVITVAMVAATLEEVTVHSVGVVVLQDIEESPHLAILAVMALMGER